MSSTPTPTAAPPAAATPAPANDKDFTFHYVLRAYNSCEKQKIYSPYHSHGGYNWRLLIFPSGNQTKSDLSVYLECGGPVIHDASDKRVAEAGADHGITRHQGVVQSWSRSAHFHLHLVHPSRWAALGINVSELKHTQPGPTDGAQDPVSPSAAARVGFDTPHAHGTDPVLTQGQQRKCHPADIVKDTSHTFRDRESDWGFCEFAPFKLLQAGMHADEHMNVVIKVVIRLDDSFDAMTHNGSYDSRKETGYVGFKNQGATCYMNSLLQTLFMLDAFRKAVYEMPLTDMENDSDMAYALQKVFYELQFSPSVVRTKKLTESFGWETTDAFTQHDVQELNRILCDHLEEKMKKIAPDRPNTIQQLFQGKLLNYIECVDVDFKSTREETFYDLSLNVKGCRNIIESFEKYTEVEMMDGDNKYRADGFDDLQAAKKGVKFLKLPPVLQLHLKRFEYDFARDAMVKINDRYEFDTEIDLSPYVDKSDGSDKYLLHSVLVHIGDVNGGHYHAFIRPQLEDRPGQQPNRWLKFDDELVTIASEESAVCENFGQGGEKDMALINANNGLKRGKLDMDDDITNIGLNGQTHPPALTPRTRTYQSRRLMNAYMLQYLRKDDVPELLKPCSQADIPKELSNRIELERQQDEQRKKDRLEQHLYMVVAIATEREMFMHNGADLADWEKCRGMRIRRATKLGDLKLRLQNENIIRDASKVRLWKCSRRHNDTIRPECLVVDGDDNQPMSDSAPRDMIHHNYNMAIYNARHYDQYAEEPFRMFVEDFSSDFCFGFGSSYTEVQRSQEQQAMTPVTAVIKESGSPISTENGQVDANIMDADDAEPTPISPDRSDEMAVTGRLKLYNYPLRQFEVLLFFKLYIPKPTPALHFLGYAIVDRQRDLTEVLSVLRRPLERYRISRVDNLLVHEEQSLGSVVLLDTNSSLDFHRVNSGDVLVLQAPTEQSGKSNLVRSDGVIPEGLENWDFVQRPVLEDEKDLPLGGRPMPTAPKYYSYLANRIKLDFKDKSVLDRDLPNEASIDDLPGICLDLLRTDSYLMVRKILCNAIGNGTHPDFLRLFPHDIQRQMPAHDPILVGDGGDFLRNQSMHLITPHVLASQMSRVDYRTFWYERTEHRLSEFEHKMEVRLTWRWDGGARSTPGTNSINIVTPISTTPSSALTTPAQFSHPAIGLDLSNGPGIHREANETSTTSDDVSIDDATTDSTTPTDKEQSSTTTTTAPMISPQADITQLFSVLVPNMSKYQEVIQLVKRRQKLDPNQQVRLLIVRNYRIDHICEPAEQVPHTSQSYDYQSELRAEPVPAEETREALGDEYQLVAVVHMAKDRHRGGRHSFFGVPFLLRVRTSGMSIQDIRDLIQQKIGVKDEEFETWKLAEILHHNVEYLDDLSSVWSASPRYSASDFCTLAVEHRSPTPTRRYSTSHGRITDKPLKIRG